MSNETKRYVFEEVADECAGLNDEIYNQYMQRYDAALPDDMPVIPEAVGEVIVKLKHKKFSLSGAMSYATAVSLSSWMTLEHEEDFARAWVLGAWCVEETGKIVKLEEEK